MKKKAIKLVIFLIIALMVFLGLSEASKNTGITSLSSIKGFYTEPKDTLDVVLIGASEIYTGYSPIMAWKEYGYTSYDLASQGIPGNMYKSMLKEALREQDPKLIVFEINGFIHNEDYFTKKSGNMHKYIDNMKFSRNWLDTIKENIPNESQGDYIFPISTYHDNWKQPLESIKCVAAKMLIKLNGRSNLKGSATFSQYRDKKSPTKEDGGIMLTDLGREYLQKLCETCQEEGVENVLFVRFPHVRSPKNKEVYPEVEKIVNSYGYEFLNMEDYEQFGLDKDHDFYNSDHLNYYGMKKFTSYFAGYLAEKYELPTEHEEKIEKRWVSCAKKAEKIFEQCEEDFEKGDIRHYTEVSCYLKAKLRNSKPK